MCCALLLCLIGLWQIGYRHLAGKPLIEVPPWPPIARRTYGEVPPLTYLNFPSTALSAPKFQVAAGMAGWLNAAVYAAICGIPYALITSAAIFSATTSPAFLGELCSVAPASFPWLPRIDPRIAAWGHVVLLIGLSIGAGLALKSRYPFESGVKTWAITLAPAGIVIGGVWLLMSIVDHLVFHRIASVDPVQSASYWVMHLLSMGLMLTGASVTKFHRSGRLASPHRSRFSY